MMARWIIPALAGVAAFLIGYFAPQPKGSSELRRAEHGKHETEAEQTQPSSATAERAQTPAARHVTLLAGLRSAVSQMSKAHRLRDLAELFRDLQSEEMAAVLKELNQLPDGIRWQAMGALMERWVELDASAAAAHLAKRLGDHDNLRGGFISALCQHDPVALLRWTQQLSASDQKEVQDSVAGAVSWRYRGDPSTGVKMLLAAGLLTAEPFRGGDLFAKWAREDPHAALASLASIENTKLRRGLTENAVKGWVQRDPAAAAAWCRQLPEGSARIEALGAAAVGMAGKELDQALTLARSLPEGRARDRTLALVADALLWSRRADAVQILEQIPFESGNEALKQLYYTWLMNDSGAAVESLCRRLESLPPGEERSAAESYLEQSRGSWPNPSFAVDAVVKALAEGITERSSAARARTLDAATEQWSQRSAADARAWAESLPEGAARQHALAGVARGWTAGSIQEVTTWLETLPASRSRDAAVGSFASVVLTRDPAGALAWMRTIPDSQRRMAVLKTAYSSWAKEMPDAAAEWRNSSPDLTAAERNQLVTSK